MRVRVRGLKRYKDRHGKLRLYHRASNTPIDPNLSGIEIAAEVARLDKLHKPIKPRAGSLRGLFLSYKSAPRYLDLAPRTKADYEKTMSALEPLFNMPLLEFTTGFGARLRDKMLKTHKAGFTNHTLAMLSSAFRHGMEYELVGVNPIAGLDKAKVSADRRKPNRPWSTQERQNVLAVAPDHLKLPLALAMFLGLRRGDIVTLPRNAIFKGMISIKTSKTGKVMKLPVVGLLAQIATNAPTGDTTLLCVNSRGQKWHPDGFTTSMKKFFVKCIDRGIADPGLTMHGLRHSVAASLKEAGYSNEQIKDYVGHDTAQMTAHYSSSADVNSTLIDMANVIESGTKREQVLSNLKK